MFTHQSSTEDAWTCKPWNEIASTSTRLSANTLPATTPRLSDSNSSLLLSMVSSHHRRPPSHPWLVGDVSSRSTMSHSDAKDILLSVLPGFDVDVPVMRYRPCLLSPCHPMTCVNDGADVLCWSEEVTTGVQSIAAPLRLVFSGTRLRLGLFWRINMLRFGRPSGTKHSLYFQRHCFLFVFTICPDCWGQKSCRSILRWIWPDTPGV